MEVDTNEVDLSQANKAQTSTAMKNAPTQLLEKYRPVFPANPTIVPACNRKLQLPFIDSNCIPHAAKQRGYTPDETSTIQSEISKSTAALVILRSHSGAVAKCVVVMKKDGTGNV